MRIGDDEIYTAAQLIWEFGQDVGDRKCGCCKQRTLVAIRYPDDRGTAYLCKRCDAGQSAA